MTQTAAIQVVPNPTASRLDRLRCAVVALGRAGADRPLERQQQVQSSINLKVLLVLQGAGDGLGFGGTQPQPLGRPPGDPGGGRQLSPQAWVVAFPTPILATAVTRWEACLREASASPGVCPRLSCASLCPGLKGN
jgi:hypothetical protein